MLLSFESFSHGSRGAVDLINHSMDQISSQSCVQQGDPLGPMLYALVLHKLVTSIDADDDCL